MPKPLLVMDQHFRRVEELFSPTAFADLEGLVRIEGARNWPMPAAKRNALLDEAAILVAARPALTRARLDRAAGLKAVIEVSGAFHGEIDYAACFERGVEVLSCAPGFRRAVAEMGLAMILAGARGLIAEHEAFRTGSERWLDDREATDVSLFGQSVGFVGYGQIARELHRLLAPFEPVVSAHDPWLRSWPEGVRPVDLATLFQQNRVIVVTAVPSAENAGLVAVDLVDAMPTGALLVLLSRAHVIDFEAACRAAETGRITFATDVFPSEPVTAGDRLRRLPRVILSPHRAAAVAGGRQLIGDMIVHDIAAILDGRPERRLARADPDRIDALVGAQSQIAAGQLPGT